MKKFRDFVSEEMSVTLKQHGSTSYKVHAVGSKMKQHGGFKVGDTVQDHHIDDLHDSGIKVRYHKESVDRITDVHVDQAKRDLKHAKLTKAKEKVQAEAVERRADRSTIIATDPSTGRKIVKTAPRKEVEIGKGKMEAKEYSDKEVRMGKGVAFDKRYKGGNMTGAYKTINKIKPGLGDHPKVRAALQRANEEYNLGE